MMSCSNIPKKELTRRSPPTRYAIVPQTFTCGMRDLEEWSVRVNPFYTSVAYQKDTDPKGKRTGHSEPVLEERDQLVKEWRHSN
eukprot:scaffold324_cov394-Prasinococcus_capsulatus_cf.AAC.12